MIYDYLTLKQNSLFEYSDIRRLTSAIISTIKIAVKQAQFEKNTDFIRTIIREDIDEFLSDIKTNNGISEKLVICDETNNNANAINNAELYIDVYFTPTVTIRRIIIRTYVTKAGFDFSIITG